MKLKLLLLSLVVSLASFAQEWEAGITFGPTQYQGDLPYKQLEFSKTRVGGGITGRYTINPYLAVSALLMDGVISGDDAISNEYWHTKRNLNFRSNILELSGNFEVNFLKYVPGSRTKRFTPFLSVGVGFFHFNPVTDDASGKKVKLHDIMTEPNKSYSLNQVCFPIGGGIKYNIASTWTLGVTYATRILRTDYLDDVSTTFIQPGQTGATPQALDLSFRGKEIKSTYPYPASVSQRGDPKNNDTYIYLGISLTKTFRKYACRY